MRVVLGAEAKPVKGILFDKTPQANWAVPWHQDLTISVQERCDVPGYDAWSEKDGVPHVQPPASLMAQILAVRIHLDDCPAENGALKIIPGSHAAGRLTDEAATQWRATVPAVTCAAQAGDALFLRPLLLHSSAAATVPGHRRVLHFEYAAVQLPEGLAWSL
ncbi:MAG: phytanoyl-CoA dioxygenase family protein [Planctomycetota bacterium]